MIRLQEPMQATDYLSFRTDRSTPSVHHPDFCAYIPKGYTTSGDTTIEPSILSLRFYRGQKARPFMHDPTTRQVELFLKAKRPKSALAIAILHGFPWWRLSGGMVGLPAIWHFNPWS
ncbi:hypothetical protein U1708_20325 [Sphingomonas sp. ZB1N12]|uniref:hypothetical protein n=1 Tax=Sphingomonas arabinosi TaxID=3096160 RepID=UPI002FCA7DCE